MLLRCLWLLPLLQTVLATSAADYYISGLPGLSWPDNSLKMHSGHIVLDEQHHGEMFFWHVQHKHLVERSRTVIWLNGGPGCSSMDGLFLEIGPFRLQDDHTLVENPGSWHESANILFVDQPLGTGFSLVDTDHYITELDQMADQMMLFLDKFLDLFPEYAEDDFYLAGESYAGQYIPYLGKAMASTMNSQSSKREYSLKGMLIGNGWIDPMAGYQSYLPFLVDNGLILKDSQPYAEVSTVVQECLQAAATNGIAIHIAACEGILSKAFDVTMTKDAQGNNQCLNGYDYALTDSYPACGMNWPYELIYMTPYLRRPDVLEAIHARDKVLGWTECSGQVSSSFRARRSRPSAELLPSLLEQFPIVLFSGDRDIICNHLSTEMLIENLSWNGGKGFEDVAPESWIYEGEAAGLYQTARNLTYVLFFNASHMVPYDHALRTRSMLERFMGMASDSVGGPDATATPSSSSPVSPTFEEATRIAEATLKDEQSLIEKYKEYYKAGTIALVFVVLGVLGLLWFIWKHKGSIRRRYGFDKLGLQEAGRADEAELEELTVQTPLFDNDAFDIDSDEDALGDDVTPRPSRPNTPATARSISMASKKDRPRSHND